MGCFTNATLDGMNNSQNFPFSCSSTHGRESALSRIKSTQPVSFKYFWCTLIFINECFTVSFNENIYRYSSFLLKEAWITHKVFKFLKAQGFLIFLSRTMTIIGFLLHLHIWELCNTISHIPWQNLKFWSNSELAWNVFPLFSFLRIWVRYGVWIVGSSIN